MIYMNGSRVTSSTLIWQSNRADMNDHTNDKKLGAMKDETKGLIIKGVCKRQPEILQIQRPYCRQAEAELQEDERHKQSSD